MRLVFVFDLYLGDCMESLRKMPDNSVDSIVTDPPYGLAFMGKKWDYDVPSVEIWAECLRVLKPGGHLLAFAGTRTQHRMAVRIEDAGFEIRDMIAWVYGSGFPKSLDVSKAIDKAAGAEREVVGQKDFGPSSLGNQSNAENGYRDRIYTEGLHQITAPATEAARQWQGWGTALKPALETVTFASKPYTDEQVRGIIQSNLFRLEARLWLLSSANAAGKSSTSNQSEYGAACAIAQWNADEITSTRADLCGQMGTSLFALATTTSLNIVSSWRRTLDESWSDGSTSTIETKSSTTIDWRTLKFSVSQITPESIIKACSLPGGFSANASTAESHFNASLSLLQSIRTLSATEPVISLAQHEHQGAGVTPNLDPVVLARKPLVGTVAANVMKHGTGALNIDGCRINPGELVPGGGNGKANNGGRFGAHDTFGVRAVVEPHTSGRWPANLIHDGSDEVLAAFPASAGAAAPVKGTEASKASVGNVTGERDRVPGAFHADKGSAARFFYCAKASKRDRDEGLEGAEFAARRMFASGGRTMRDGEWVRVQQAPRANFHPTVKPTDLMAYLCRLVTPPSGVVLDPFMGSGSTGKAAMREGFRFIGCELSAEYLAIARARIEHELAGDLV